MEMLEIRISGGFVGSETIAVLSVMKEFLRLQDIKTKQVQRLMNKCQKMLSHEAVRGLRMKSEGSALVLEAVGAHGRAKSLRIKDAACETFTHP